jgi:hypothetical protein
MASRKPGATTASGFRNSSSRPDESAAPRFDAAANPRFSPASIRVAPGAASRIAASVSAPDALSTTISSSPLRSWSASARSVGPTASRWSWVTTTTERVASV